MSENGIKNEATEPKIQCIVKNGIMFFNCTQKTIDNAVESENRRKAYLRIGEWADDDIM